LRYYRGERFIAGMMIIAFKSSTFASYPQRRVSKSLAIVLRYVVDRLLRHATTKRPSR
jgi:hypothetical protein